MKKTLVAIAALAATGAFAQVTLTGNFDVAGSKVSGTQLGSNATTFSSTTGTSSTSVINITAVEDIGAGMKVKAHYGLDPRTLTNDAFGVTEAAATKVTATGLSRDEAFVSLAGSVGEIKLGAPNSIGLNVFQAASPLGTGVGSGYAPNAGTQTNSFVNTRYNRSMRFDSAVVGGFTASVLYAPGNDEVAVDAVAAALQIQNARKSTEVGLKYANGPLNIAIVNISQAAITNKTGWYSGANAAGGEPAKTSATVLGANYNFGNTTVYYGYNTGDRLAATSSASGVAVKSKGSRIAVKQTIGQVDLMAQYSTQETTGLTASGTSAGDAKGKVTGFRADYNLSKTAAVYAGYEKWDTGLTAAAGTAGATAGVTGDRKIVSFGLRKAF